MLVLIITNSHSQSLQKAAKSSPIVRYNGSLNICPGDTMTLIGKSAPGYRYNWEIYDNEYQDFTWYWYY